MLQVMICNLQSGNIDEWCDEISGWKRSCLNLYQNGVAHDVPILHTCSIFRFRKYFLKVLLCVPRMMCGSDLGRSLEERCGLTGLEMTPVNGSQQPANGQRRSPTMRSSRNTQATVHNSASPTLKMSKFTVRKETVKNIEIYVGCW